MQFENCPLHPNLSQNLIIEDQLSAKLVCSECFDALPYDQKKSGVFFNKNTLNYFFEWNRYLIDELNSILNIVIQQGSQFLLQNLSQNQSDEDSDSNGKRIFDSADTKQILSFVIANHINLLHANIAFMKAPNVFDHGISPFFLKDLFTILAKSVKEILEPIKKEFDNLLGQKYYIQPKFQWKQEVITCIEAIRHQIKQDLAKFSIVEVEPENFHQKDDMQKNELLQTQHSFNKSNQSSSQIHLEESTNPFFLSIQSSVCQQTFIDQQVLNSLKLEIQQLKKENEWLKSVQSENDYLKQVIAEKDEQLQIFRFRLMEKEEQNETLFHKCKSAEHQNKIIQDYRIPQIERQVLHLQEELEFMSNEHDEQQVYIAELESAIQDLQEENLHLSALSSQPKYYLNPMHEKQQIDQKLVLEVVQLQANVMQKDQDIKLILQCLKQAKKLIFQESQKPHSTETNSITNQWQDLIVKKLSKLQSPIDLKAF